MATAHNKAEKGDIAKFVIMPGDPLRAKFISDNFLKNPVCFNSVRGMLGFTGHYGSCRVSVMASGMGMPSMGIYSYELFNFYDVDYILRIGSCGSYLKDSKLGDVFLVEKSFTDSNFAYNFARIKDKELKSDDKLNDALKNSAKKQNIQMRSVNIMSTDIFYRDENLNDEEFKEYDEFIKKNNIAGSEMESFSLFSNALVAKKKASCLLTISDFIYDKNGEKMSADERQNSFLNMMKIALGSIEFILK